MRDGTGATLRGLAGGWLSGSVRLPLQSYSVSFKSHTHSVTSWWAGGLVGYVLATTAPRCLDMVGAVMLLRCQQAMSLSGVSTPSWCCVGGRRLARHLTARGHLDSSRGCLCGRRRRSLGKSCNRGGDILPEAQRPRGPEYQETWFTSNTATSNPFGRRFFHQVPRVGAWVPMDLGLLMW